MTEKNESVEVVTSSIDLITKAEIDMQISTAKAFPRDVRMCIKNSMDMISISEDVAQSCVYALPRDGKNITGPSVRLAEIVSSNFGNLRTGARIVANDGRWITAQGICHDLETNNCVTVEVKKRITTKAGKTYSDDMQTVTGNAACAVAFRNAVFKVIPAALVEPLLEKAKEVAKGEAGKLADNITKALLFFTNLGVTQEQVFELMDVKSVDEITPEMLVTLRGMATALKNGDTTVKELFSEQKDFNNA